MLSQFDAETPTGTLQNQHSWHCRMTRQNRRYSNYLSTGRGVDGSLGAAVYTYRRLLVEPILSLH